MRSYATGIVNGYRIAGGLLGSNRSGIIHSCYARVNVTRTSGSETFFGGFMGDNYLGKVINCYSTGWVKFGTVIQTDRGFCGSSSTWGSYDEPENYWDTETSGAGFTLGEATGKTSAEMKDQDTYKSWDFSFIWNTDGGINDGYPYLRMLEIPNVTTSEVTGITPDSAISGGEVTADNGFPVTARGVIWKANGYPIITDNEGITTDDDGTGEFISILNFPSGLTPGARYHVRAYATNSQGTAYGETYFFNVDPFDLIEPAGEGTEETPYEIATLADLYWLSHTSEYWDKHYIQTADINASETATWFGGEGFIPIGPELFQNFSGNYNGQQFIIDSLTINRPSTQCVGLFGYTAGATIKNMGLTNVNITGGNRTAAYIGYAYSETSVSNSFSTGIISGETTVGGLVSFNTEGTISSCYSICDVSGYGQMGGLVGYNRQSVIENSYSRSNVSRKSGSTDTYIGAFVGRTLSAFEKYSIIRYCYSTGTVTYEDAADPTNAGFGGGDQQEANYFDKETSLQISGGAATPKTTAEMKTDTTFEDFDFTAIWDIDSTINEGYPSLRMLQLPELLTTGVTRITSSSASSGGEVISDNGYPVTARGIVWSTSETPTIDENDGITNDGDSIGLFTSNLTGLTANTTYYVRAYAINNEGSAYGGQVTFMSHVTDPQQPVGDGTDNVPYEIANLNNLLWLRVNEQHWDKYYIQTDDIDASSTSQWFNGKGWDPIGIEWSNSFTGSYDGQFYSIDSLYINRPDENRLGLFGHTNDSANLKNMAINGFYLRGKDYLGGLVGYSNTTLIDNCFTAGTVRGTNYIGGLAGTVSSSSTIHYSYSTGDVTGNSRVGGFAGRLSFSTISNAYSRADVLCTNSTTGSFAGFLGEGSSQGAVEYCYCTGAVTRQSGTNPTDNGFIGTVSGGPYTNNYFDKETSQQDSSSTTATPMSTAAMKTQSIYTGWDFENTWRIKSSTNDGYPYLYFQASTSPKPKNIQTYSTNGNTKLYQNTPNPFSSTTKIKIYLPVEDMVKLTIYDSHGKIVSVLYNGNLAPGHHLLSVDGNSLGSGIYFYRLVTRGQIINKKMMLIK